MILSAGTPVICEAHSGVLATHLALHPEYKLYSGHFSAHWRQGFLIVANAIFIEECLIHQFSVIMTYARPLTSAASVPGR